MNRVRLPRLDTLLLLLVLLGAWPSPAAAALHTFPAGSLIIPVDPCWQPAASDGSQAGAAGVYGLAYHLQRSGIPLYLADNQDPAAIAFVIHGQGAAPVVELPGETPLAPPPRLAEPEPLAATVLDYRGEPFLIDSRDLDAEVLALFAAYPQVRRHRAQVPFTAPVARVVTGLPTTVAVADSAAAQRLQPALVAAGLSGNDGLRLIWPIPTPATGVAVSSCRGDSAVESLLVGECGLPTLLQALYAVPTTTPATETVTTGPLIDGGVLYIASGAFPGRTGHLRAFLLHGGIRSLLWDAADRIPAPGVAPPPGATPAPPFPATSDQRLIFTNAGPDQCDQLLRFDAGSAGLLQPRLGTATVAEAAALINAWRGRLGTCAANPDGIADRSERLGAISSSTPALVGASPFIAAAANRDRVVYVGSEHGLLHAFRTGRPGANGSGLGQELWAYLPGALLPALRHQPAMDRAALAMAQVDGSPAVSDQFGDFDGDGRREWRTVLVGTASGKGVAGIVFALDVTDPALPQVLWERSLGEIGLGRSRGVAIGPPQWQAAGGAHIFVTGAPQHRLGSTGTPQPYNGRYGVLACALSLADGRLVWQFAAPYEGAAANLADPPAPPALLTASGEVTGVLFGDLTGRLWALNPATGAPLGGSPAYQLSGGSDTPLGGGVAVQGQVAIFASGGSEHAPLAGANAVYAVEWTSTGPRLLWSCPLQPGERLWGTPWIDQSGKIYLGLDNAATATSRLLILNSDGTVGASLGLTGRRRDSLAMASGVVVSVSQQGRIDQIGEAEENTGAEQAGGRTRVLTWRYR